MKFLWGIFVLITYEKDTFIVCSPIRGRFGLAGRCSFQHRVIPSAAASSRRGNWPSCAGLCGAACLRSAGILWGALRHCVLLSSAGGGSAAGLFRVWVSGWISLWPRLLWPRVLWISRISWGAWTLAVSGPNVRDLIKGRDWSLGLFSS